jgi:hypothetical protein
VSALALAAAASPVPGNPRRVIVTNSGSNPAVDLAVSTTGLPAGTVISSNTCGTTLAAGASCSITLTPGATPTATAGDASPPTARLDVAGSNTNTRTVNLSVIVYGSLYQGGWVFDIDDTTANTGSIGGKVASRSNVSGSAVPWNTAPTTMVGGISETSTVGPGSCDGAVDGACNTARIVAALGAAAPAAFFCDASTADGYTDWYLPAICEMGYGISQCGTQGSPTLYGNMQSRLKENGDIGSIDTGFAYSSTEDSMDPTYLALMHHFDSAIGIQVSANKGDPNLARCVRALTP